MNRPVTGLLPQAVFGILLGLSAQPTHGYALRKQIEEDSAGRVILGPGALYGNLTSLSTQGFIEEMPFEGSAKRRYYRLTKKGWDRLSQEAAYYAGIAALCKERKL